MDIVYTHDETGDSYTSHTKVYGLRKWKEFARKHADNFGVYTLVRKGRAIRMASAIRHVTRDGQPKLFVYERAV